VFGVVGVEGEGIDLGVDEAVDVPIGEVKVSSVEGKRMRGGGARMRAGAGVVDVAKGFVVCVNIF
jgi:hypothetical protein